MDFNNIRHVAIIHVFIALLIMFPLWYVMAYLPMRDNRKWHSGRGCAKSFHGGIVSWAMLYTLGYLGFPVLLDNPDICGFFTLNMSIFILLGGVFTCISNRFIEQPARKYFTMFAGSQVIAGSGLLVSGIFWLAECQRPVHLEGMFFKLSLLALAVSESAFLYNNNWKCLPRRLH